MNVRDVYEQCKEAFEARVKEIGDEAATADCPSESYFYEQFVPAHALWSPSARYTGRFGLVLRVIERTFRAPHVDEHYCAAERCYMQHFAVDNRDFTIFASLDDKNNIVVGDPNRPIATIERGRRVLVAAGKTPAEGGAVQAMDHDAGSGVLKAVPTVTLLGDIPASARARRRRRRATQGRARAGRTRAVLGRARRRRWRWCRALSPSRR